MARRGKFGRLPRVAPSLTNEIVSIAREAENRRDQNLMDAWQKGGTFEGQKATDELVIAHWKDRLKNVAKDDPLHDTYGNAVAQYTYSIAESKASTEYAQGKRTDAQMAQFYLGWSKKVPKDSEFYRVLQRDAAQFMRAAKAKGAANAKKAAEEAYQNAQNRDYNANEKPGDYITEVVRNLARSNALIGADQGTDVTQFDPNDPGSMLHLLAQLNLTSKGGPNAGGEAANPAVLYHDPITGKAVTGADIIAQLHKLDPHFDGRVTLGYVRTLLNRQLAGQGTRLDRATQTGHATDVANLKKWQQYTSEIGREVALWPIEQSYQAARTSFLSTWQSGTATPDEKIKAWQAYAGQLSKLAADPKTDDNTRARLQAEINGEGGVKSLAEDFTGLNSTDQTTPSGQDKGDIADTHFDVQRYLAMQQAVLTGQAAWTTGSTDSSGVFHAQPGGAEIGAATYHEIEQSSPVQPAVVFVPQHGVSPIAVVVTGVNITATATDGQGQPVTKTDSNPVGSAYDVTIAGVKTRIYSFKAADGHTYYSTSTPWDDSGVKARDTPGGIVLDMSAYVPHQQQDGSWVYPNGQPADLSGTGAFGLSAPNNQGEQKLVINTSLAVYTSDPARAQAGIDPATDFFSPTLAALSATPEGLKVLASLRDNPQFQAELQREAQMAATDINTGQIDQNLLDKYNSQITLATHLPEAGAGITDFLKTAQDMWDRSTTRPTFQTAEQVQQGTLQKGGYVSAAGANTLPSDAVRGTQFGALGNIFQPGTNLLANVTNEITSGLKLQLANQIKVPTPPAGNVTPQSFTPTTSPSVTPVTTTVPPTTVPVTTTVPPGYYGTPGHTPIATPSRGPVPS